MLRAAARSAIRRSTSRAVTSEGAAQYQFMRAARSLLSRCNRAIGRGLQSGVPFAWYIDVLVMEVHACAYASLPILTQPT